nr:hypothetical protein [Tanacetum cinerariifolium]
MLSKRKQTIFDAPFGFVELYTHSFTLSNIRIPLLKFFCEVLNYFKVNISLFNPFGLAKLMTFDVMCKAYGGEPNVELLKAFLNIGHAGNWMTLSNRGETNVPRAITKPFTYIKEAKAACDAIREREKEKDKAYDELEAKDGFQKREEFAKNMADLDSIPSKKDEVVLVDRLVAEKVTNRKASASSKVASKKKQTASMSLGRETHQKTRKVSPQASNAA